MTDSEDKDKESRWRDEVRHQTHDPIPGMPHRPTHAEVLKQTSTHAPYPCCLAMLLETQTPTHTKEVLATIV
jgi:hypothetical protein